MKSRHEMTEELLFKEEQVKYWEEYGCVLSKDDYTCNFVYPEYAGVRQ
jgi:hypothetical protein